MPGVAVVSVVGTPVDQLQRSRTLLLLPRDALRRVAHRTLGSCDGKVAYAVVIAETTAVMATRGPDGTLVGESVLNGWETDLAGTSGSCASGAANDVGSATGAVSRRSIAAGVLSLVAVTVTAAAETQPRRGRYAAGSGFPGLSEHGPNINNKIDYIVFWRFT